MNETDLHFFIDSTINYFDIMTKVRLETGIPYLSNGKPIALEFTGIIGVSGTRKGSIYLTTSAEMLKEISEERGNQIRNEFSKLKEFDFGKIYNIVENDINKDSFMEIVKNSSDEVKNDYMLTHVKNLNDEKRKLLFNKFPVFEKYF